MRAAQALSSSVDRGLEVGATERAAYVTVAEALAVLVVVSLLYYLVGHTVERALELTAIEGARALFQALTLIGRFVNEYPSLAGAGVVAQVWAALGHSQED